MSFKRIPTRLRRVTSEVGSLVVTDEAIANRARKKRNRNALSKVPAVTDPWGRK